MRFAYEDISTGQFERLVVAICHELLGAGVQGFTDGPDGGRDAKFVGTAECFPSSRSPLMGTTIVQAKHSSNPVAKFSGADFSGDTESSVLSKEIVRVKRLKDDGQIDNYILFSNRKLGGIANEKITRWVVAETGVTSVHLVGIDDIERYIKRFPYLATDLKAFEHDLPLGASPDELAEVIVAIAVIPLMRAAPVPSQRSIERIHFEEKNEANDLSDDYSRYIRKNYLKHFEGVRRFLADPRNHKIRDQYECAAEEFEGALVAHRRWYNSYDLMLDDMLKWLLRRDSDLAANKRLTRTVFFFMYWACDVGSSAIIDD